MRLTPRFRPALLAPLLAGGALLPLAPGAQAEPAARDVAPARQAQLMRMLRQDCGSCHGMRLTGGLGPALTRQALAEIPLENLQAVIFHGRPGTPMPGFSTLLSAEEAQWLARRLHAGVPEEDAR